ncbi:hypothetical protein [Dactylosporangium sp. NPDC005555]|uniref:hypothetical protein n=1 Tax=Dactylosporangium sp. NPDC005555 TaxID=3154889 RepID=UPI0033A6E919
MVDVREVLEQLRAAARSEGRGRILRRLDDTPETLAALRAVRRDGPGHLRLTALDALAYLGGEAALEPADIASVERLVRIRRRNDALRPVMSCWTYWWCIPSNDQTAVMASIGLTGPRPVTYDLACSVIDILEHCDRDAGKVYVGPAVNGWTPVVGPGCNAFGKRHNDVKVTLERLSAEYGEAHAFYFGAQGDGSAWLVARNGATVRRFSSIDPQQSSGEPLPIERQWMRDNGVPGRPEEHLGRDDDFSDEMWEFIEANDLAATISLDVGWRHPTDAATYGGPLLANLPGTSPGPLPPGNYKL